MRPFDLWLTFVVSRQSRRSAGPGPDVLLLVDAEGRVESVKKRTKGDSAALDLQVARLGAVRFAPFGPVAESVRVVRHGRITCTRGSRCVLALDLPNVLRAPSSGLSRAAPSGAEVRIQLAASADDAYNSIAGQAVAGCGHVGEPELLGARRAGRHSRTSGRRVGTCVLALTLALRCGDGRSPSTPTPTASSPAQPPTTLPAAAICPFGKGSNKAECSRRTPTELLSAIDAAIDRIAQQPAGILDVTEENPRGSRQYRVLSQKAFIDALLANLSASGFCAEADYDFPLEAISVKSSNEFSEDFVVLQWGEWVRRGHTSYVRNCKPAAFPVDPDPEWPPSGSGCGKPYPEPIHHFNAKVHAKGRDYWTLDSTPIVGPDANYCQGIGYTDGRAWCPVRTEGSRDRVDCENWRVGKARDNGRDGPTWQYRNGESLEYCQGLKVNGCENHPDNQYGLLAARGGTYVMCAQNGACGEVKVDR